MMHVVFCDSCKEKIAEDDPAALNVQRRCDWFHLSLCGRCSAGLITMLKDMRLIKDLDTIR